jgi:hypothetical protein
MTGICRGNNLIEPREEENRLYPVHEFCGFALSIFDAGQQLEGISRW